MPDNEYVNEAGTTNSFKVALRSQPSNLVILPLDVSNPSEGRVSPSTLVFDDTNWTEPRTVRVSGIDDYQIDGNQQFEVKIGVDPNYRNQERIVRFISLDSTEADGSTANDQDYSLEFSNSSSDDSNYDGLKIQSVPLKHLNLN